MKQTINWIYIWFNLNLNLKQNSWKHVWLSSKIVAIRLVLTFQQIRKNKITWTTFLPCETTTFARRMLFFYMMKDMRVISWWKFGSYAIVVSRCTACINALLTQSCILLEWKHSQSKHLFVYFFTVRLIKMSFVTVRDCQLLWTLINPVCRQTVLTINLQ